ncbi:hypothetical protein NPX13_g1938 [Xylaria arbuscula]|uniref:Heterokaryon incompatibility domain-containing protein n=1 Tax=Xylaria arbuscula TaxID=114810 RepID=A0A9W8TPM9_9PEZI|nr:hypothetical protein NPX13_g1938 [Xylaria arbuscula]
MRLINTSTLEVHEFTGDSTKEYAILSHTWGEDECTLQGMSTAEVQKRAGYAKIQLCCTQARLDGLDWAWVDTCCIDKTSTTELSEAINSMFRWYSNAKVCYAYLADVNDKDGFASSRWFSRGWTLQELIAPKVLRFYSSNWTLLGFKSELCDALQRITGIDTFVLETGHFSQICVAKRMSWASRRETTRSEDRAYSLMGIFNVNMPLIYGEGKNAFTRLQQEILRVSDDQSLFAWGAPEVFVDIHKFPHTPLGSLDTPIRRGLFADSPMDFSSTHDILQARSPFISPPPVIYGNGVRVQYPVVELGSYSFIVLGCTTRSAPRAYITVPLKNGNPYYARHGPLVLVFPGDWTTAKSKALVVKEPPAEIIPALPASFRILRAPNELRASKKDQYILDEVFCLPRAAYHPREHSIFVTPGVRGPCAALFFTFGIAFEETARSGAGRFPVRSFAIVLGFSKYPWAIFVPILRDTHADEDFYTICRHTRRLISFCMTKSQLKDKLRQGDMIGLQRRNHYFDHPLCEHAVKGLKLDFYRHLRLSVSLDIDQINLVDETVFVSIDIYEIDSNHALSKPGFVHSNYVEYRPGEEGPSRRKPYFLNWVTMHELEWFQDRMTTKHPGVEWFDTPGSMID